MPAWAVVLYRSDPRIFGGQRLELFESQFVRPRLFPWPSRNLESREHGPANPLSKERESRSHATPIERPPAKRRLQVLGSFTPCPARSHLFATIMLISPTGPART